MKYECIEIILLFIAVFQFENYVEKVAKYFCFVELISKILNCFLRRFVERLLCCLNELTAV